MKVAGLTSVLSKALRDQRVHKVTQVVLALMALLVILAQKDRRETQVLTEQILLYLAQKAQVLYLLMLIIQLSSVLMI
jgi:hypothetical protein